MTLLSRRAAIGGGAMATVLVPVLGGRAAAASRRRYARGRFAPLVGRRFTIGGAGSRWSMTLREVGDLPHGAPGDDHQFTLTFRSRGAGPTQGTCVVSRPRFAATDLFIVPIDETRRTYVAVINQP